MSNLITDLNNSVTDKLLDAFCMGYSIDAYSDTEIKGFFEEAVSTKDLFELYN
jgi:hypothetical protein